MENDRNIYRQKLKEYSEDNFNKNNNIEDYFIDESILEKIRNFISYYKKYILLLLLLLLIVLIISLLIYKNNNKNEGWDNLIDYIKTECDGELKLNSNHLAVKINVENNKKLSVVSDDTYVTDDFDIILTTLCFDLIKNNTVCELNGMLFTSNVNQIGSTEFDTADYMRGDKIIWDHISYPGGLSRDTNNILRNYWKEIFNQQLEYTIELLEYALYDYNIDTTMSDIGFYIY